MLKPSTKTSLGDKDVVSLIRFLFMLAIFCYVTLDKGNLQLVEKTNMSLLVESFTPSIL